MARWKFKNTLILLLATMLAVQGCSKDWVENQNELLTEFTNLFNPTDMSGRVLPDKVIVVVDGRTARFDKSQGKHNVEVLAAIMRRESLSGSEDEVKGHEIDRVQVGSITVSNTKATSTFDFFRSKSLPRLFSVETHYPDDFHAGILYMLDANDDLMRLLK